MKFSQEAHIAEFVREAVANGSSLEIVGHGTKRAMGRATSAFGVVDVSQMSGIVAYEPEELILIARAGTGVAEIEAVLRAKNQMLAFEPADWGPLFHARANHATLGGIVSADACGPRRVVAGAVRDSLLGCRFVNGRGEVIRAGSRVMKNVTGFDMPKLMCGAWGTLGVITEVTFKLAPRPARAATFVLCGLTPVDGCAALRRAGQLPVEASGLAFLPRGALALSHAARQTGVAGGRTATLIRVDGEAEPLAAKLELLAREFLGRDIVVLDDAATDLMFAETGNGGLFVGSDADLWRLCVPPSAAADAADASGAALWYADWAGGLVWLELPASFEVSVRLRELTARFGGYATMMRAPAAARAQLPVFEPEPPARAHLTAGVKTAFDPHHVLNPGRMYEDV